MKTKTPELTIFIPVYNEEPTLKKLLNKVKNILTDEIELIIVDDASKDKSPEIIQEFISSNKDKNVRLFTHNKNKGKGAGIQTAIKSATGKYFVIQDADLEYDPIDILPMLSYAKHHEVVAIYGSRFLGDMSGMARANYYANRFYNFLLRRLYDTRITDMHTCYKMIDTTTLKQLKIRSNGFGYAPELVSKLLKKGVRIYEIPVSFEGRTKRQGKKIGVKDGFECIHSILSYRFMDRR